MLAAPIPLDDALSIVRDVVKPVGGDEVLSVGDALGRCLALDVTAPRALPPFDNSAVDGYAFSHPDISDHPDVVIEGSDMWMCIQGESAAGVPFSGTRWPGGAIRISTGAVLPEGADTVAMQEDCRLDLNGILISPVPRKGANVRFAGGDIRVGETALSAGQRLRPQDVALLHALGVGHVTVKRRLRIAIASTGTELRETGAELEAGQIIETNAAMLAQSIGNFPVDVTVLEPLPDDRALTEAALAKAGAEYDLIVTTGGVSVGDHDHVRPALASQGKVHFWRLALRPGKPVLFGRVGGAAMLGLPGNPVSAMVTFLMIGLPVIQSLLGATNRPAPGFIVALDSGMTKSPKLREFPRARLTWAGGAPRAELYRDQSSNLLTSLSWADGILDLPACEAELKAGDSVIYRPFAALLA
jgi:molybdopterin molybdotransferase